MYNTALNDASYSDRYNDELSSFVSSNTVEMLTYYIEEIEDIVDTEDAKVSLKYLFPEAYVDNHSRLDCLKVLKTIRDRMQSAVFYDSLTPLQKYVLHNTIESWIDLERSLGIDLHRKAPDHLKDLINEEAQEPEYVISVIEDLGEYAEVFFEDWDFEPESIRGWVQAAIHNTERFLHEMSFEDLDQYIEVMPVDVIEEYKAFRESKIEEVTETNMFSAFPTETLLLKKKTGEEIEIVGLVSSNMIGCDQANVNIEEGDILIRSLPNGAKEFYMVEDRGFYRGNGRIKDHYQCKVKKVDFEEVKQLESQNHKPHKLFISHASKDKEYMSALVEMLEDIGMPEGSIVCTSVPGYGIPGGARIYDWLRSQFLECELRVLFAFSNAYYASPACLNEMGAAWVTKATDTLMLLPGFGYNEIKGCVDNTEMGISFDSDEAELKHRLNELKDTLIDEYSLPTITSTRWERHRDKLIKAFREIADNKKQEEISSSEDADPDSDYKPIVGKEDVGSIPVDTAFLLVFAAGKDGQILRIQTLGSAPEISAAGKKFMADSSMRESARWQEALDQLVSWGWVKPVGNKGEIFQLTGTGYRKADWLKEAMNIDTNREPLDEIKEFQ